MDFFIQQNSTLPDLIFPLTQKLREEYQITDKMLENVAVTFSMIDAETGIYKIANVPANINYMTNHPELPNEHEYALSYRFKLNQTTNSGRFIGEFKLDFLGEYCGKLTLPVNGSINIQIGGSITKTTVI